MSFLKLLFLTVMIIFPTIGYTEPNIPIESEVPPIKYLNNVEKEAELYKKLYEASKAENDKVITILQSSIAIVSALLFAFLGSQVYFNFKIKKEEINNIRLELEESISSSTLSLEKDNLKYKNELKETLNQELKDGWNKLEHEKNNLIENFNIKIEGLKDSDKKLKDYTDSSEDRVLYRISHVEKHLWKLKDVDGNVLRSLLKSIIFESNAKINLSETFKEIECVIKKISEVDEDVKSDLLSVINKDNNKELYFQTINNISTTLNGLRVFKYIEQFDGSFAREYLS